jgi:hypothetical protein
MPANGTHSAVQPSRGPFDPAVTEVPEQAEPAETSQPGKFTWVPDSKPASEQGDSEFRWLEKPRTRPAPPMGNDPAWSGQGDAGPSAQPAESGFAWLEKASPGPRTAPADAAPAQAEPGSRVPSPRYTDGGVMLPERVDFFIRRRPAPPSPEVAPRSAPDLTPGTETTAAAGPRATAGPAGAEAGLFRAEAGPAKAAEPQGDRRDRYFMVRLLTVILLAALIGSALVLLLR